MSTPTDTPRTDAATFNADTYTGDRKVVDPDDMAEIERELTDAKAEFERLANPCGWPHCEPAKADAAELTRLRAENDEMRVQLEANKLKGGGCQCSDDEACAHVRRAEKAEADTARLDWLGKSSYAKFYEGPCVWRINGDEKTNGDTLREAIDAAMKGTI